MTNQTEKRAPVQGYPGGIPWAIHLEAYEVYCLAAELVHGEFARHV